jgi:hypothetical protein
VRYADDADIRGFFDTISHEWMNCTEKTRLFEFGTSPV